MYAFKAKELNDQSGTDVAILLGCELQFPIKEKFYIETGLNLRFGNLLYTYWEYNNPSSYVADNIPLSDFDSDGQYIKNINGVPSSAGIHLKTGEFLDIPLRFSYRLRLKGDNEFQFSFGPYLEINLHNAEVYQTKLEDTSPVSVGLTPSVVFKHRALSLGLSYQNPCIYNGFKNRDKNTLMFTIGVNFRGRKINTDKLLSGLAIASSVLDAATTTMQSYTDATGGSSNSDYSESSTNSNSSYSKKSEPKGNGFSISKRTSRENDRNTYSKYETQVMKIINGDDKTNSKVDLQRKMRKLREKWAAQGDGWQPSKYETM